VLRPSPDEDVTPDPPTVNFSRSPSLGRILSPCEARKGSLGAQGPPLGQVEPIFADVFDEGRAIALGPSPFTLEKPFPADGEITAA